MTCVKGGEILNEEKSGKGSKFATIFYFGSSERRQHFSSVETKIKGMTSF